jgi:glycopeptide antibiotics resistance protein
MQRAKMRYELHKVYTLSRSLCCIALFGVIYATLFSRDFGTPREVFLQPFYTFAEAKLEPDLYRQMMLNIVLFIPFGLSLPFAMPGHVRHKQRITVLAAMGLSILIEVVQYIFGLGRCETDDVIMNTLGAFLGSTAYLLAKREKW